MTLSDGASGLDLFLRITRLRFTSRPRCTSHRWDVLGMLLSSPWFPPSLHLVPPLDRLFVADNVRSFFLSLSFFLFEEEDDDSLEAPAFYSTVAFERDRTGAKWIWQLEPRSFSVVFFNFYHAIVSEMIPRAYKLVGWYLDGVGRR